MSDHSTVILDTYIHTKVMKTCHTHPQSTTPVRPDADDELQQSIHRVIDTQLDLVASSVGGDHQLSATGEVLQVDAQLQIGAQVNLQAMISVVTLSLHTLFLPVTHSLHTLFLPLTLSLHTLFLPLTRSLLTLFLPLTLSLHTFFLPVNTHGNSQQAPSQFAHPFSTSQPGGHSAKLFLACLSSTSSLPLCRHFTVTWNWKFAHLTWMYLSSGSCTAPSFAILCETVCLPHAELCGELCAYPMQNFQEKLRLPHAELWGELCAYPMQSCEVNCVLTPCRTVR